MLQQSTPISLDLQQQHVLLMPGPYAIFVWEGTIELWVSGHIEDSDYAERAKILEEQGEFARNDLVNNLHGVEFINIFNKDYRCIVAALSAGGRKYWDIFRDQERSDHKRWTIYTLGSRCMGACANTPTVQLNDDYYECLTPQRMIQLMESGQQTTYGHPCPWMAKRRVILLLPR